MVPTIAIDTLDPYTVVNCEKDGSDYKVDIDFNTLEKKWKKLIDKEENDSKEKVVDSKLLQNLEKIKKPRKPRKNKKEIEQSNFDNNLEQEDYLLIDNITLIKSNEDVHNKQQEIQSSQETIKLPKKLKVVLKHSDDKTQNNSPSELKTKLRVSLKKNISSD